MSQAKQHQAEATDACANCKEESSDQEFYEELFYNYTDEITYLEGLAKRHKKEDDGFAL